MDSKQETDPVELRGPVSPQQFALVLVGVGEALQRFGENLLAGNHGELAMNPMGCVAMSAIAAECKRIGFPIPQEVAEEIEDNLLASRKVVDSTMALIDDVIRIASSAKRPTVMVPNSGMVE